ncbi:MAG: ribonuclease E activity regulator RraA [Gammaproteobacteria bacterium]|nr:ribonuclease E activity regulator RraA [Gammaproteobacteria bacterium]
MPFRTSDLCDAHADRVQAADPILKDFGGCRAFQGPFVTVRVFEDDSLLRTLVDEPGQGRVLVIDGGGIVHCALVDEELAERARVSGWAGLVINGCVRHSANLAKLAIGIKALAAQPMRCVKHGIGERDVPLRFANIHFLPGHYLYADEDGLLVSEQALI